MFTFFKLCIVDYSINAEPWTILFRDFAFRKKEKVICVRPSDCHFMVCSVSSVSILISTSNKYHSFSYLVFVTFLVLLEVPQQCVTILLFRLLNFAFILKRAVFFYDS